MYASILFILLFACVRGGYASDSLELVQLQSSAIERVATKKPGILDASSISTLPKMKVGSCIGDVCVQGFEDLLLNDEANLWDVALSAPLKFEGRPACARWQKNNERILLIQLVPPFHGSTALTQVFMSSENVTTLCTNNEWQCEGGPTMTHLKGKFDRDPNTWTGDAMLREFSKYWNLSRPVLIDKTPRHVGAVPHIHDALVKAKVPPAMHRLGIGIIRKSYVIMWRPVCLSYLSTAGRERIKAGKRGIGEHEFEILKELVEDHKYLKRQHIPSLVVNMGDLLWRPHYVKLRLESFMPCLGNVNMEYMPTVGKDVYQGNSWKADGSVKSYGQSINPQRCCGYDPSSRTCSAKTDFYEAANETISKRAHELVEYMNSMS